MKKFLIFVLIVFVSGCAEPQPIKFPPVVEGWQKSHVSKHAYVVQKKDTLYSIAWAFGLDYRDLAEINNLESPYSLRIGQKLYIAPPSKKVKAIISYKKSKRKKSFPVRVLKGWQWPTNGRVIAKFSNRLGGNRGVNIKGIYGQSVKAANAGVVVYSDSGIRAYGKLIIIKHNDDFLSAYAYNQHMLVKEGQRVKRGQDIATMGQDSSGRAVLHFEVRRFGKSVNPELYLPKKR